MAEGNVVTFYSYKGGVGRTMALANVGALLCQWGYRVLCVDWDLEAPGLHLYFEKRVKRWKPGITDMIGDHVAGRKISLDAYVTSVEVPKALYPLGLMTAGKQDSNYVSRLQGLDWPELYAKHDLGAFVESLRAHWKSKYDFVLVDSRTGITDIGGICTVQLPDQLVLLFTANEQGLRGSLDVIKRSRVARQHLPFDRGGLQVLPVPTRFELRVEYEMSEMWLERFARDFADLYSGWADKDITPRELLNHTRLPYIPYWSFGEKLAVLEKGTKDPEDLGFAIETLAALVAHRLGASENLVVRRDSFVRSAQRVNGSNGSGVVERPSTHDHGSWRSIIEISARSRVAREVTQILSQTALPSMVPAWATFLVRQYVDAVIDDASLQLAGVVFSFFASLEAYLRAAIPVLAAEMPSGQFESILNSSALVDRRTLGLGDSTRVAATVLGVSAEHLIPLIVVRNGFMHGRVEKDGWKTTLRTILESLPALITLIDRIESKIGSKFNPLGARL